MGTVTSIADARELYLKLNDGRDLVISTGTCVLDPSFTGTSQAWQREEFTHEWIGPPWTRLDAVALSAGLASISHGAPGGNAGWAVDWARGDAIRMGEVSGVRLVAGLAVAGVNRFLDRFNFTSIAVGLMSPGGWL